MFPVFLTPLMSQQPQSRWLSALVALVFLAGCSQSAPSSQVAAVPGAIASPAAIMPAPSPLPSAVAPVSQPAATNPAGQANSGGRTKLAIAPASVNQPQAAIAQRVAQPSTRSSPRTPTFQATSRMAGFSPDSNYFIYLESSRDTGAGVPRSALQLVNVGSNRCVTNGCIETHYSEAAGAKTTDAETALLQQTWKVRQDLNLTPPVIGTNLPILSRSRAADGSEIVTVQLTNANYPLQLHLHQKKTQAKAAMQLEVNYNGQQRSLDSLSNFRPNVLDYSIRQVTLSPDGKRVAVLITTTKPTFEGTLGTTLVQGFAL